MSLDRRAFLRQLGFGTVSAAAAVCTFDLEKLLWMPGERTILLPSLRLPAATYFDHLTQALRIEVRMINGLLEPMYGRVPVRVTEQRYAVDW